jgi:phage terminase large subunit GpA-like protein
MHWPISNQFGTGYFEQLTAERALTRYSHGQAHKVWTLPSGKRNEALDLNVYALAVLNIKKPNLKALAAKGATARRARPTPTEQPEAQTPPPAPAPTPPKPKRPKPGGWMSRYR